MLLFALFTIILAETEYSLIETKNPTGAIINFGNLLDSQRNLWVGSNVASPIEFYGGDIDIAALCKGLFNNSINVSEQIHDLFTGIFDTVLTDSDDITINSYHQIANNSINFDISVKTKQIAQKVKSSNILKTINLISSFKSPKSKYLPKYKKLPFLKSFDNDEYGNDYGNNEYKNDTENSDQKDEEICPEQYPNAHEFEFTQNTDGTGILCEDIDKIIGQAFSCLGVVTILVVFFVIGFIFYCVNCFGCCCCCRPKENTEPSIVSIIFFVIAIILMVLSTAFSFAFAGYMYSAISFLFSDTFYPGIANSIDVMDGSISHIQQTISDKISSILNDTSKIVNDTVDSFNKQFEPLFTELSEKLVLVQKGLQDLDRIQAQIETDIIPHLGSCQYSLDIFKDRSTYMTEAENAVEEIYKIKDIIDFANSIKSSVANENSDYLDSINDISIDDQSDSYNDTKEDFLSFSDALKEVNDDFQLTVIAGFGLFLPPLFMLITAVAFSITFWTKSCCSRCIASSAWCQPTVCNFYMLAIGAIACYCCFTVSTILTIINGQGDDIMDAMLGSLKNSNGDFVLEPIDLTSKTEGLVKILTFDPIHIGGANPIKAALEASLNTNLVNFLDLENAIPLTALGNVVNQTFSNAATNIDTSIITKYTEDISDAVQNNLESKFNEMFQDNIDIVKRIDDIQQKCHGFDTNELKSIRNELESLQHQYEQAIQVLINAIIGLTPKAASAFTDLFDGVVFGIGNGLSGTFKSIYPILMTVDMSGHIGFLNAFRSTMFYDFSIGMAYQAVSAYLWLVGQFIMVLLLWIRRKGMLPAQQIHPEIGDDDTSLEDSSSKLDSDKYTPMQDYNFSDNNYEEPPMVYNSAINTVAYAQDDNGMITPAYQQPIDIPQGNDNIAVDDDERKKEEIQKQEEEERKRIEEEKRQRKEDEDRQRMEEEENQRKAEEERQRLEEEERQRQEEERKRQEEEERMRKEEEEERLRKEEEERQRKEEEERIRQEEEKKRQEEERQRQEEEERKRQEEERKRQEEEKRRQEEEERQRKEEEKKRQEEEKQNQQLDNYEMADIDSFDDY